MWLHPPLRIPARKLEVGHAPLALCLLLSCSSPTPNTGEGPLGGATGSGGNATGGSTSTAGKSGTAGASAAGGSSPGGGAAGSAAVAGTASGGAGALGGSAGSGEVPGTQEYGFTVRKPGAMNLDWLCTFDGDLGYVYARLLQTGTERKGIAETPIYAVELAQISIDGKVSDLANAGYDYGGGHHNDALSFDYDGGTHSYYHSSFGFGFRSCQPMDCRNVYALGTTTLQTEGCGATRSLPEACVTIDADGTHAALVDKFAKCPGDTQ